MADFPGASGIPGGPAGGIPGGPAGGIPGGPAGGIPGMPEGGFPGNASGGFPGGDFPGIPEGGFPEVPGLPDGFDATNFDTFGDFDFGSFEPDFNIPAMQELLDGMMEDFTAFVPDLTLFESFNVADVDKLTDTIGEYFKELKIEVSEDVMKACAEEFSKATPSEEKLIELGIPADMVKEIKADKVNELFGAVNFFEDLKPEAIASDIESKLADFKGELEAGMPEGMDIKKFSNIVNKQGFDTQGLKKMMADPKKFNTEYKAPEKNRRRADEGVKTFGKTQVQNQADLAGTQQAEAKATAPTSDGSNLFVSTLAIGFSAVGSFFVF